MTHSLKGEESDMKITEHILTNNDCYKAGRTIVPKGIMVHSPGVAQPDVNVFLRTWNRPDVDRCVHAFVHEDGVTETLPWNWRGWHAGVPRDGGVSANNTHISFEILEPAGHTYDGGTMVGYDAEKNAAYFKKVYANAVELAALLCRKYGLDPNTQIVDHAEGYQMNIASNHADVGHWFPKHGKSMDTFRADVQARLNGGDETEQEAFDKLFDQASQRAQTEERAMPASDWANEDWDRAVAAGIFDGTAPRAPLSREQAAVLLGRLGLIPEAPAEVLEPEPVNKA